MEGWEEQVGGGAWRTTALPRDDFLLTSVCSERWDDVDDDASNICCKH